MNDNEKIISMLEVLTGTVTQMQGDISDLKQGQVLLQQDMKEVKQRVTRTEVVIENDVKPRIQLVAEQHGTIIEKLDGLKELNEKVIALKDDTDIHRVAISELSRRTANL